ncbi:hypothetical protein AN958_09122 [Leucoagaricus sp. SymC.cos]|nr:hypothetical protein AN958_09122 [Leucoagaricus sp. SymC.cos]
MVARLENAWKTRSRRDFGYHLDLGEVPEQTFSINPALLFALEHKRVRIFAEFPKNGKIVVFFPGGIPGTQQKAKRRAPNQTEPEVISGVQDGDNTDNIGLRQSTNSQESMMGG